MSQKFPVWASKNNDISALGPFDGSFRIQDVTMQVHGHLKPDRVKFVFEHVDLPNGMLGFIQKHGVMDAETGELTIDADRLTLADYLPFAIENLIASLLSQRDESETEPCTAGN